MLEDLKHSKYSVDSRLVSYRGQKLQLVNTNFSASVRRGREVQGCSLCNRVMAASLQE